MKQISKPAVDAAVADYRRGLFPSIRAAARAYNVAESTVRDRYHGKPTRQQGHSHEQILSPLQEKMLVRWSIDLEACAQAPTHAQLRSMASLISQSNGGAKTVSESWITGFKRRNPQVRTKRGVALDVQRSQDLTEVAIQGWYDGLSLVIHRKSIQKANCWNVDEMGNAFRMVSNQRVIGSADTDSTIIQAAREREWVTTIECINPIGAALTPLVIFKGKHVQEQWFIPEQTPDWAYTSSNSAFTTNDIGLRWLREIFIPQTQYNLAEGAWRLLILDGHKSHISQDFIQAAYLSKVWCYYLIPHTSHIFQPLDLAVFSSLKRKFRAIMSANPLMDDMAAMKKAQFLLHYKQARTRAITLTNCAAGFSAGGIWPFNPSKGLNSRFIPVAVKKTYNTRAVTPPPAVVDADVVVTPYNRTLLRQAIRTVERGIKVDRATRTLFAKTQKAIDSHSVELAVAQRKVLTLITQLDTFKKKQKKKRAVNSNLLFVGL